MGDSPGPKLPIPVQPCPFHISSSHYGWPSVCVLWGTWAAACPFRVPQALKASLGTPCLPRGTASTPALLQQYPSVSPLLSHWLNYSSLHSRRHPGSWDPAHKTGQKGQAQPAQSEGTDPDQLSSDSCHWSETLPLSPQPQPLCSHLVSQPGRLQSQFQAKMQPGPGIPDSTFLLLSTTMDSSGFLLQAPLLQIFLHLMCTPQGWLLTPPHECHCPSRHRVPSSVCH